MITKQTILSLAIALIFVLFVGYGIEVFHDNPDYPDLHHVITEENCTEQQGKWVQSPKFEGQETRGFCEVGDQFKENRTRHDKIVFIVSIIVGLGAVIVGMVLRKDAISTGVLGGGVLTILYGTIRYWDHASDILKFILLGVALAVLIWVGYTKLK
ncbi:TPA: hypothetical protein HA278_07920 [Candidatus Woesearchaeota archaeon]|nr:hypothetical protein [archaeon]HIJ11959.1 hypothetical protein [Candidatus Woesearchaeota archaeon]